jgi:hypothetical protein
VPTARRRLRRRGAAGRRLRLILVVLIAEHDRLRIECGSVVILDIHHGRRTRAGGQ